MVSTQELLAKQKNKFKNRFSPPALIPNLPQKQIQLERMGATRPWQEGLPQYQNAIQIDSSEDFSSAADSTNKLQSDNSAAYDQPTTKWPQTDHKVATKRLSTGHKLTTKWPQKKQEGKNHFVNRSQSDYKVATEPTTTGIVNRPQSGHKLTTKQETTQTFLSLIGLQRKITLFIYGICKNERSKVTPPLSLEIIASALSTTTKSIKGTIQRLEQKEILRRVSFKNGRGGWSQYELPDSHYHEISHHETKHNVDANRPQSGHKLATELTTSTSSSSSSSNRDLLKTTTTGEKFKLSEEWLAVDTSGLEEFGIKGHNFLYQLARSNKLTPKQVQDSIWYFAFDVKRNGKAQKIKGDKITYLLAPLKRGEPYQAPSNYEDPAEEAMRKYLASSEKHRKQKQELQEKVRYSAFEDWVLGLTEDEKQQIAPCQNQHDALARNQQRNQLFTHFEEQIWPALEKKVQNQINEKSES